MRCFTPLSRPLAAALACVLAASAPGITCYVSTEGSDTGGDGSAGHPFGSPAKAVAELGMDGGEVLVLPGEYAIASTLALTAPVAVRAVTNGTGSVNDIVTFRASGSGYSVVSINHALAAVDGLEITGGNNASTAFLGGGVNIGVNGGSLRNCRVYGNSATKMNVQSMGVGVYMVNGLVDACLIEANTNLSYYGGGARVYGGGVCIMQSGVVSNSTIRNNCAGDWGAGVYIDKGTYYPVMSRCRVYGNVNIAEYANSYSHGAGVAIGTYTSTAKGYYPRIEECTIFDNHAWQKRHIGVPDYYVSAAAGTNCFVNCAIGDDPQAAPPPASGTYYCVSAENAAKEAPYNSWSTAHDNLNALVELVPAGSTIRLGEGVHTLNYQLVVEKAIHILGISGAQKTILRQVTAGERVMLLNHPDAVVSNVAITGGRLNGTVSPYRGRYRYFHSPMYYAAGVVVGALGGTIVDSVISNNTSVGTQGCGPNAGCLIAGRIARTRITANRNAGGTRGGTFVMSGGILEDSLIDNNYAVYSYMAITGGGLAITGGTLRNCTVVDNTARSSGGGVTRTGGDVVNCVIFGNRSVDTESHNCHGTAANFIFCATDAAYGPDDVVLDENDFTGYSDGDYTPVANSAIRDAGMTYALTDGAAARDFAGRARVSGAGGAIDIGAYEIDQSGASAAVGASTAPKVFSGTPVTFTAEVVGGEAFDHASYGWSVMGTPGASLAATTTVPTLTAVDLSVGNFTVSVTITRYDAADNAIGEPLTVARPSLVSVVPQTLHVAAGNAGAAYPYDMPANAAATFADVLGLAISGTDIHIAAGLYTNQVPLTLLNGVRVHGAGHRTVLVPPANTRAFYLGHADALVENLVVSNSVTTGDSSVAPAPAGYVALINVSGGTIRGVRFTDCNSSGGTQSAQGMICAYGGTVSECEFIRCVRSTGLGTLYFKNAALRNAFVHQCKETLGYGTVVYTSGSTVENCTLAGNCENKMDYGALRRDGSGTIRNCIIWGNTKTDGTTPNNLASEEGVTYSCIGKTSVSGTGNINTNPLFSDNSAGEAALSAPSPCINAGTPRASTSAWARDPDATDLYGNRRLANGRIDIGCHERVAGATMLLLR